MNNYSNDIKIRDIKLTSEEMLKLDTEVMSYEEAFDYLKLCQDLSLFNGMDGTTEKLFNYKHYGNKDNYKTYVAMEKVKTILRGDNTYGFTKGVIGRKLPKDTTLNQHKKSELIELLHIAQHNYSTLLFFYEIKLDKSKCSICKKLRGGK